MCHILCAWPPDTARDGTMTCKKTGKDFATKVALQKVAEMLKEAIPDASISVSDAILRNNGHATGRAQ